MLRSLTLPDEGVSCRPDHHESDQRGEEVYPARPRAPGRNAGTQGTPGRGTSSPRQSTRRLRLRLHGPNGVSPTGQSRPRGSSRRQPRMRVAGSSDCMTSGIPLLHSCSLPGSPEGGGRNPGPLLDHHHHGGLPTPDAREVRGRWQTPNGITISACGVLTGKAATSTRSNGGIVCTRAASLVGAA